MALLTAKDHTVFSLSSSHPIAATVSSGSIVTFETGDEAYERLSKGETLEQIGIENVNAVTGPLAIQGAEPGDTLKIEILSVEVTRSWSVRMPGFGPLGTRITQQEVKQLNIDLDHGVVRVSERLSVPLRPMIGCIATAPDHGVVASTCHPVYSFGGNMDLKEATGGATIWLPVQVSGGLLFVGDLHGAMGTAEPAWVGFESAGRATLRVSIDRSLRSIPSPRMHPANGQELLFIQPAASLEQAHAKAIEQMWSHLTVDLALNDFEAHAVMASLVDVRFGGPAGSIVILAVPLHVLNSTSTEVPLDCPID